MWFGITQEQLAQWVRAAVSEEEMPLFGQRPRCGGCGQYLPKDLSEESYLVLGEDTYHMTELCLTNGVKKMRKKNSTWDWGFKEILKDGK